ncbi:MAG: glycosyltransferase family 4 protein [Ferruginibacter sp.]
MNDEISNIHIAALVSYKVFPAKMGGQKGIAFFYSFLARIVPVTIITTRNNDLPTEPKINFLRLLGNSSLRYIDPLLFFKIKRILKENKCTHLVIEHPYYGWLGILLKLFSDIKLVVHSHNIESERFKSNGKWWWQILWQYEKITYRKADINFFISEEDREFAINNYKVEPEISHTITYGFERNLATSINEKRVSRKLLQSLHPIDDHDKILLFNGTLDYKPNLDAVEAILMQINPLLLQQDNNYKIIICGKALPLQYLELKSYATQNIIYAGFVDDINVYFKGADIFINPVTDGGGIKTKLVEALGYGLSCVSSASGAIGVPVHITGKKLFVVNDNDWISFANAIMNIDIQEVIPQSFYDHFYWGSIAQKVKRILSGT